MFFLREKQFKKLFEKIEVSTMKKGTKNEILS